MSQIDRDLLERYLSGHTSDEERERVEAWLAEDPERWATLADFREVAADGALSPAAVERAKAEVWARLASDIGARESETHGPRASRRATSSRPPRFTSASLAAALLLALLGGTSLGVVLFRSRGDMSPAPLRVAATTPGQRARFRLPDGTEVVLGVASTLRYPASFPERSREVSLEGEAYFDVIHDERRSFAVRAGDLVAKDVGTEFTVRNYPEDAGARVVVREGRVAIRAIEVGGIEQVVEPGQLGRLGQGRLPTVEAADTAAWFAWTEGRLVFDGTPLREAMPQLGRWFDLEFRLADSALGDVPLTATLKAQPSPEVLDNLAASLGMKHRRAGRIVTLYAERPER